MLQDIAPHQLKNEFKDSTTPQAKDLMFAFVPGKVLLNKDQTIPTFEQLQEQKIDQELSYRFLFQLDEIDCYLVKEKQKFDVDIQIEGWEYESTQIFRTLSPLELAYAGCTAYHLYLWYRDNQFCGRCGTKVVHDTKERMVRCPGCKNMIFPRIAPSVIVGVIDRQKDRILVTRYKANRNNYRKYALVAGFTEIGETVEETVKREVMEECGLRVQNITYYKSQPWGFSGGLLLGYYAELDGTDEIRLDEEELSEGRWMTREELILDENTISLTREMMAQFKEGKI